MRITGHKRVANRKLRQRRPFRRWLPAPHEIWANLRVRMWRARAILASVAALALLAGIGWLAWRWVHSSPRFSVSVLEVNGNVRAGDEELARLAGVTRGSNVFAVSTEVVEERVKRSPWVARARAERRLPNRIIVDVEERRAAAAVLLDALYLADRAGRVFKRADVTAGETEGLVVVTGLERRLWQGGSDAGRALVARALYVVEAWRFSPDRPAIGEVHVDADGVTLYTVDKGVALRVGDALGEALEQRFSRFDAAWGAMTHSERKLARTFHLDSTRPDRVTVRLAGTQ